MRKLSEIIKEASQFEEMEDTLLLIYDLLGKPRISEFKVGKDSAWVLRWDLDFSLNEYNGSDILDKVSNLFESIREIRSSQKRVHGYDVEFKISAMSLFIRLTPSSKTESTGYRFINKREWREIQLNYGQLAKFFVDNGSRIKNVVVDDDQMNQTSSITIATNASMEVKQEFKRILLQEFQNRDDVDANVSVQIGANTVDIYPDEEKTYLVIDQDI